METITILKHKIQYLQNSIKIDPIFKGFSTDQKYRLHFDDQKKILLRVGAAEDYERKKVEFEILHELRRRGVNCPTPMESGVVENICYSLFSYIEGADAKELLPTYTEQEQYTIGLAAGKDLARMHTLQAPAYISPWHERAMQKHLNYVDSYKTCGVKIKNDEAILTFIEENAYLLKERPNQFQHDDFHLENIILKNKHYNGVIDFNGYDWGDPIHDFVKIAVFTRNTSIPFSIGQIDGYFNGELPKDFWSLYSIYVAMVIFSSVIWAKRAAPDQLDEMIERLYVILEDHKDFELLKPIWYE